MSSHDSAVIPLSERDAWRDALTGLDHAFAHTWESCHAMQLTTGWPTFLYVYGSGEERIVCPFAERSFEGTVDVVTPYGFSGFAGAGNGEAALDAWHLFAQERRYVCGYIGLNPALDPFAPWGNGEAEPYNEVFLLDLRHSEDELFSGLSTNRKRAVVQWRRQGAPVVEDRQRLISLFLDCYPDFMERHGAAAVYRFSRATLEYLLELDSVFLVGASDGEQLRSVAVFAHTPAVGEYLFGVSTPGGAHHSAPLVWEGALRLRRLGVPLLNLGGGISMGDGVAEFKRRFGATPVPLRRLRQVYDCERFDVLCRRSGADPSDWSGYFPPYRRP